MKHPTTRHFNDFIVPFDLFLATNENGRHYYVCVYTQDFDGNNALNYDVYGLIVTSNPKYEKLAHDDYNAPIKINGKKAYVCCDKWFRFKKRDVKLKYHLDPTTIKKIKEKTLIFLNEIVGQIGAKEKF